MSSHFGNWSPNGLPNFQMAIVGVKIHWIEKFLISIACHISLENSRQGDTTLIQTSFQLKVFTKSYGPPKLRES
jgi:hypothetical protein